MNQREKYKAMPQNWTKLFLNLVPRQRRHKYFVGFPLQLLFGPFFLYTNMFKGNPVCQKVHRIVKYIKLKQMNSSIELRELVLDMIKFINKALLKETLIIDGLEWN